MGAILGAVLPVVNQVTLLKMAGPGVLYTELISIPILILPPIILPMARQDIIQWLGFCVVMHGIFGLVLGLVVSYGLRAPSRARRAAASHVR